MVKLPKKASHKALSEKATKIVHGSSIKVICHLADIMAERGLNQTELAQLTGLRQATINAIIHNTNYTINKEHMMILMLTLKLTDISELYEVTFSDKEELARLQEEKEFVESKGLLPEQDKELEYIRQKKAHTK